MAVKSKCGSQDWFYHAPSEHKPPSNQTIPAPSQIPGLSQIDVSIGGDDDIQYKRKWIRESDSKYTKLAKTGGRKDLFMYKEHKPSEDGPVPYPRSDWFDHDMVDEPNNESNNNTAPKTEQKLSEWFGHEEHKRSSPESNDNIKRPMLGYDKLNIWKREEENTKLPALNTKPKTRKSKSVSYKEVNVKLPKIMPRGGRKKSIDNGEMNDLLAFNYQKDFLQKNKERSIEERLKKHELLKEKRDKLNDDNEKFTRQKKIVVKEDKPLFKLSKFDKIPSKVNSYRS